MLIFLQSKKVISLQVISELVSSFAAALAIEQMGSHYLSLLQLTHLMSKIQFFCCCCLFVLLLLFHFQIGIIFLPVDSFSVYSSAKRGIVSLFCYFVEDPQAALIITFTVITCGLSGSFQTLLDFSLCFIETFTFWPNFSPYPVAINLFHFHFKIHIEVGQGLSVSVSILLSGNLMEMTLRLFSLDFNRAQASQQSILNQ